MDMEGFWKIPFTKIKHKGDHSKLERFGDSEPFKFENPFKYSPILKYIVSVGEDRREQSMTMRKLRTTKMGKCDGLNCSDLSLLGPYDVHSMQFKTECVDRRDCVESSLSCRCDAAVCKNRSIQKGERKVMDEDVVEQLTFGIDQSTRHRITKTLRAELGCTESEMDRFVVSVLQTAMNAFMRDSVKYPSLKTNKIRYKESALNGETAPFFMVDVLRMILHKNEEEPVVDAVMAEMTQCLLAKIERLSARNSHKMEKHAV